MKIIYEKDAIDALHKTMLEFFKTDGDDEPKFITASEKMLLSVNKAISNALKALPSAQSEIIRCKDCIKRDICRTTNIWAVPPDDYWYCGDAERRTDV